MAKVQSNAGSQYVLITAEGSLSRDEIVSTLQAIYSIDVSKAVLWDLRKANLDQIRLSDFKYIAAFVMEKIGRTAGKAAYVGSPDVFRQCSMYAAVASMDGIIIENAAFLRIEDAEKWIVKGPPITNPIP